MPDVFSTTTTGIGTNLVTLAYDKLIETNLRVLPKFREIADKKIGSLTHNGSSIRFQFNTDISDTSVAGATLEETVDPDSVSLPATSYLDIAALELGRSVLPVKKINLMSIANIDPWVANAIGFNMTKTLDNAIVAKLDAGANIVRVSTSGSPAVQSVTNVYEGVGTVAAKTAITAADTIKSEAIRRAVTKMRAAGVQYKAAGMYVAYIHPEVSADLRTETGNNVWRTPHEYQNAAPLYGGETGSWEGVRFIETANATNTQSGSGSSTTQTRVYNTYVVGAQALAEAVWKEPGMEVGNVEDRFNRFSPAGWYGIINWALYRTPASVRIETAASGRPNA
jgi:N4-gp56 family major capsid protein